MKKICLIFLCLTFQCSFPKRLQNYPIQTRQLFLHNFANHSHAAGINRELELNLRQHIRRRSNFNLSRERKKAYLWLQGQITSYQKTSRFYRVSQEARRHELLVLCRIRLQENPNRIQKQEARLLLSEELGARVYFSEKEGYVETEAQALKRLLQILALRINQALERSYLQNFSPL